MAEVRGSARGHASITATHAKTLELTRDAQIGATASCVVAVGVSIDERALTALRGEVELTLSSGGHSAAVRGRLNPAFAPGDPLVVRRAPQPTRNAVLIGADLVAAELDRELVAALGRPDAEIAIAVRQLDGPAGPGVLVVDIDDAWRTSAADDGVEPDLAVSPPDGDAAARALADGGRVALLRRLDDPAAAALIASAHADGHTVLPARGLAPVGAALAVAGVVVGDVQLARHGRERPEPLAPGTTRVVTGVPADRVIDQLAVGDSGVIALDLGRAREELIAWRTGTTPQIADARNRSALVVVHATADARDALRADVAALALAMLDGGISVRDVARAITDATGLPRRDAYARALALKESRG